MASTHAKPMDFWPHKKAMDLWHSKTRTIELPNTVAHWPAFKLNRVRVVNNRLGQAKGIVAVEGLGYNVMTFLFYPLRKHYDLFARSVSSLRMNGPGAEFPGAVGSIEVHKDHFDWLEDPEIGIKDFFDIPQIQSHFRKGYPKELGEKILSGYYNWHFSVLTEIFKMAERDKRGVCFMRDPWLDKKMATKYEKKSFLDIAEELGWKYKFAHSHVFFYKK